MKKLKSALTALLGYGIMALLALLGGNIMHLFGFQYQSLGSLLLFFLLTAAAGAPIELLSKIIPKALLHLGKLSQPAARGLFILLDLSTTAAAMALVDGAMKTVSATPLSILVIGLLMALFCVSDIK